MIFRYSTLTVLWILIIMVLTFTPGPSIPPLPKWKLIRFDTFVHSFIFAVLVFLMTNTSRRSLRSRFFRKFPLISSFFISFLFGCLIEVTQPYVPGRTFDYYDILSNTIGCFVGVIAVYTQNKFFPYLTGISKR